MANRSIDSLFPGAIEGSQTLENLQMVWSIGRLLRICFLEDGYHFPEKLSEIVVLTEEGRRVRDTLDSTGAVLKPSDAAAAILGNFASNKLLIDVAKTEVEKLRIVVSREIENKNIRFPNVFGTELYDKFFFQYPHHPETLTYQETSELLSNTSQGVFQIGRLVTGPLGLLRSGDVRILKNTMRVPLFHCDDIECRRVHSVALGTGDTQAGEYYRTIKFSLRKSWSEQIEWARAVESSIIPLDIQGRDIFTNDALWLFGNALSDSELNLFTELILNKFAIKTRDAVSNIATEKNRKDAEAITSSLNRAAMVHLAASLDDQEICQTLETLIVDGKLDIPGTETRSSPINSRVFGGLRGQRGEISRFGIRFIPERFGSLFTLRLKHLIKKIHSPAELDWKISQYIGETFEERFDEMLRSADLRTIAADFLLDTKSSFEGVCEYLSYAVIPRPLNSETKEKWIEAVLWRLGFNSPIFPDVNLKVKTEILNVRDAVNSAMEIDNFEDEVRGFCSRLFASAETILGMSLSFSCWTLLNDHFGESYQKRFTFNLDRAHKFTSMVLNNRILKDQTMLRVAEDGNNNLYAIENGFSELSKICSEYLSATNSEIHARSKDELPKIGIHLESSVFPFLHKIPLLDLHDSSAVELLTTLNQVAKYLSKGNVAGIRNQIQHGGRKFPALDEIRVAVDAIDQVVESLESSGLCPMVFNLLAWSVDSYNREKFIHADYLGRTECLSGPSVVSVKSLPLINASPQIIVRSARLKDCAEVLRFTVKESSPFSSMWEKYPRRAIPTDSGDQFLDLIEDRLH